MNGNPKDLIDAMNELTKRILKNDSKKKSGVVMGYDTKIEFVPYILPERLSSFNKNIGIKSSSDPELTYSVNLFDLTCTCPDFYEVRSHYPPNDIRRICKHIHKTILESDINNLTKNIIGNYRKYRVENYFNFKQDSLNIYIGYKSGDWVDVIDEEKRYGYNPDTQLWAYSDKPKYHRTLRKFFEENFIRQCDDNIITLKVDVKFTEALYTLKHLAKLFTADNKLSLEEVTDIVEWYKRYKDYLDQPPLNEFERLFIEIIEDGIIDDHDARRLLEYLKTII